jgi:KTSC domain
MTRISVRSSTLVSVRYDEQRRVLEIEFNRMAVYQYLDVPKTSHVQLMASSSKGRFFDQRIREKFITLRVS